MRCWGSNPHTYDRFSSEQNLEEIRGGSAHICGRYTNGSVSCHGNNVHKQVSALPKAQDEGAAEDFYTYRAISVGARHSCGLRTTGNIRCWGDDLRGQATPPGANDELNRNKVEVGDYTAVSAGDAHTCGLRRNDIVVCWGNNDDDQATPP